MSVVGRKRCLDQWVSPADPRIEKGHIARVGGEVVGAELQEVLRPAGLFDNFERIEAVGGYRRRGQGADDPKASYREGNRFARRLSDGAEVLDRKSTRRNSSNSCESRMPPSA